MIEIPEAFVPSGCVQAIETIDMHTGGEPLRVLVSGPPLIQGETVLQKRSWFRDNLDHVRRRLMWEPRGHKDMYGAVLTTAPDEGTFDVFFLHNEGYSTMCGHAIIALTRLVFELGWVPENAAQVVFNVPCGRIIGWAEQSGASDVPPVTYFRNVASYVELSDCRVDVPGVGTVSFDIAYGGTFYAIVEAAPFGRALEAGAIDDWVDLGRRIKAAVASSFPVSHPDEPELGFLYGVIFTGAARDPAHHSRNICIFADGEVDRSATGSGVSARAALHHARGDLSVGDKVVIESVIGSTMSVRLADTTTVRGKPAILPEVAATAHFTGRSRFWIERSDPLCDGFLIR
jgi:trans-L-3-hydroxyproline dehydratase